MARVTTRRALFAFTMAVGAVALGAAVGVVYGNLPLREAGYWLGTAAVAAGVTVWLIKKIRS